MPLKRWMFEAPAIVIAAVLLGFMLTIAAGAENMTLPNGQPLFGDFTAFWSAGRVALDGHAADVHVRAVTEAYQREVAPDVRYFAPWNSPPPFLLIACVLALMPYPVSALVFLISTLALFLYAMRKLLPDTRALLFVVTAPAVIYHAGTVQAGLLIAGVSALALYWLDTRPRLAGAFVGLLVIKPHLALLWPLYLALTKRWNAFLAAAASALVFCAIAALLFGFESYGRFLANLAESQDLIRGLRITTPAYASLYANLLGLGLPHGVALALHGLSACAAVAAAAWLFMRGDKAVAGAALCAATLLISPYLFFYDFTLLMVGAALLGVPRTRLELLAAIFAWGSGLTVAVGIYVALPICPLAAWLVLIAAMQRARSAALHPAPAQQP